MHNINIENERASYIGRQAAWHTLGTVTGTYSTWQDILQHGGLDFAVVKQQLEFQGVPVEAWGTFRMDNGAFLGAVGKDYTVIQHARGFEMIDALVQSVDGAHYETAGVLGAGETVWGLADLKLSANVGADRQNAFLLFSTSHDGTMAHTYRTCLTRVVCQNTLTAALGERAKSVFRVRHTVNSADRIQSAHNALATIQGDVKSMEEKLNFLAQRKTTRETMTSVFDRLFPVRKDEDGNKVSQTRRNNILGDVLRLYESNDRNAFPEQRGTGYNLLNAITNYSDHERSSQNNGRAESAMFGSGDRLKSQALQVILETAEGMPAMRERTVFVPVPTLPQFGGILDDILNVTSGVTC